MKTLKLTTQSTVVNNSRSWSFEESGHSSEVAERIKALQRNEPCLQSLQYVACPSDFNGQAAFIFQQGQAINFYRELLTLFSIYLKQDVLSVSRRNDLIQAERIYGEKIRALTEQMNTLIAVHHSMLLSMPLGKSWREFIAKKMIPDKVFNKEIVRCQKEEKSYQQKYFALISSLGLPANKGVADQLHTVSRDERKKRWLAENKAWKTITFELDKIFDDLLQCRHVLAQASGLDHFAQLLEIRSRSAGIPDSLAHDVAGPCRKLLHEIHQERKQALEISQLRPFDMATRNMRVFKRTEDWIEKTGEMLRHIHPQLACSFAELVAEGLCDLYPRKGKSSESFCQQLPYSQKAYIFLNMHGSRKDVMNGIHEVGHALHIFSSFKKFNRFFEYKVNPATSEFFALTLELLSLQHLDAYYADGLSVQWAKKKALESILNVFTTYNTIEMFEKKIYSTNLTAIERRRLFARIITDNLGLIDYSGYEEDLELWCYRIPLLVASPGYFANYAYTQLGAVFFADQIEKGKFTSAEYISLMQDKGTASIGELYEAIGFRLTPETIKSVFEVLDALFKSTGQTHSLKYS